MSAKPFDASPSTILSPEASKEMVKRLHSVTLTADRRDKLNSFAEQARAAFQRPFISTTK